MRWYISIQAFRKAAIASFLIALLLIAGHLHAQTEKYIQVLTGNITKGDSCVVTDDKFNNPAQWGTIESNLSVNNLLTFELRYDTPAIFFDRNFSCSLLVDIEYETADRTKHQVKNISLEVNYDTAAGSTHQGIARYKFNGGHHVKLTVNKISSPQWGNKIPPAFRIKNEIVIERLYVLNTTTPFKSFVTSGSQTPASPLDYAVGVKGERLNGEGQQQTISWDAADPGFPQYDFEWTFYDDNSATGKRINQGSFSFSAEGLEEIFKNNCSRVTVSLPSYQLNLLYNSGWVFYRVRGVRYDESAGVRTEGLWSYHGSYNYNGNDYGLIRCNGHEEGLNWQYTRSFAEDGKSKEIVGYFDGSMRRRQTVALNNGNGGSKAVVQENIFDALGRSVVSVLPAPSEENTIHFFADLNRSAISGGPYQYTDFQSGSNCIQPPAAMSTVSGASRYYSPNNPLTGDNSSQFYFTKYIPDAKGFPFSITSFTADNTGRIRTQGGVGPVFQPGKAAPTDDHTTKYFYGKPQQEELDRLFGNEAGNAAHYLKNMVTDANGQTSISFINPSGKTVATALAGKIPGNLNPLLAARIKNTPVTTTLTDGENAVRDAANLSITSSTTFLAVAAGTCTLQYEFTPLSLQVLYGVANDKICADCYYDLDIRVTDNCGNQLQSMQQEAVFTEKTTCDPAPTKQQGSLAINIPEPGEYQVSYQLKLSRRAVDYYTDQYLLQDISLKKEIDFQRDYLGEMDLTACFNNCETCLADLGTELDFINRITSLLRQQHSIAAGSNDTAWIKKMYAQVLAECRLAQEGCGKTATPCEEQTLQLKQDVSPGGQYMLYDPVTNLFTERDINVFIRNKTSLNRPVVINGIEKPFNQFSEQEIIAYWNDDWANILLPYHPENTNNCLVADCGKNAAVELYENRFLNTVSVTDARARLFWSEDDYAVVVDNDPYFRTGAEGALKKAAFLQSLSNFRGSKVSITAFVRWTIYCSEKKADGNSPAQITPCPRTAACNREQDEWSLFKMLYNTAKQEIKDKNNNCSSKDIFPDPANALTSLDAGTSPVPSCTPAALFDITNKDGLVSIQYNGSVSIPNDITVDYFGVDAAGKLVAGAAGKVVFRAGTAPGSFQSATGSATLTYIINFARCDLAHPYYAKERRNYNGLSLAAAAAQVSSQPKQDLNATAAAAMLENCNESCEQYADGWMKKLEGCELDIASVEFNQIREGLLSVCKGSCQVNVEEHPFGASSTPVPTPAGDKNFKDVLLRVLGASRFSAVCNNLLLDYPAPITAQPLYANEVVRALSACSYEKLMSWKMDYGQRSGYNGFADFIRKTIDPDFALSDAAIDELLTATENNCFTPLPFVLPASLSCTASQPTACLSCTQLQDESLNFQLAYPYVGKDNPAYYELLAKFINLQYAFNLSSVDVVNALQQCVNSQGVTADTVDCAAFTAACRHFEALKPGYFTNPNGNPPADSVYKVQLTGWLNTELHRQLGFAYYKQLATVCGIVFNYPGNQAPPACDTSAAVINCFPQFITCCEPFAELEKFREVFTDSADARLLAYYFLLQRTQWCTPVNLPNADFHLAYDSLLRYFNSYRRSKNYFITVRPDSLLSYRADSSGSCDGVALNFRTNPGEDPAQVQYLVCNKALQPLLATDDNSCINQQVSVALGNAHSDYLEFIEKTKRDYRDAYYVKCLSITPRMQLETVYNQPQEYHYTLYYYDQAGNLVKTVPPAGVQPIDEGSNGAVNMQRVKNYRLADKDYCYQYGDAPTLQGNGVISVADNPLIRQNALPFTIEAFVSFSNFSGTQVLIDKSSVNTIDNTIDGYRVYLKNGRLAVDMAAHGQELWIQTLSKIVPYQWPDPYSQQAAVPVRTKIPVEVPRMLYRSLTAEITSNLNDIVSAGSWVHLAVEYTGNWTDAVKIFLNGNLVSSRLLTNKYEYIPALSPPIAPAEQAAGTTEFSFAYSAATIPLSVSNSNAANLVIGAAVDGLSGSIKQVRLYNRVLSANEIRSNAFNTCLVPQSESQLVAWLPLNKEESAGASIDRINQLLTVNSNTIFSNNYQPVYPAHKLPVHYYYNSLNTLTKQVSPDAGTSIFFYDLLGRMVASQNTEQKTSTRGEANNRYSYTKYDITGRIIETGEKTGALAMTGAIAKTDPNSPGSAINTWLASGSNTQITQNIYDQPNRSIVTNLSITANQNVYNTARKRIVATIYRSAVTGNADYNSATHYQYDISGNVKRLWQEYKKSSSGAPVNMLKEVQYDYDFVSGKVNSIIYQSGKGDQFIYKYEYDPDNRLLRAYSGRDVNTLQQDAAYSYYQHGPLARMELGDALTGRIVQGNDYAYTLQGWLKGINAVKINAADGIGADMGSDGSKLSDAGIHAQVGKDVLAMSAGYYKDDYSPIGGQAAGAFSIQYQYPAINGSDAGGKPLFNGNISNTSYAIAGIKNGDTRGYSYGYDQLNRILALRAHNFSDAGWSNSTVLLYHQEAFNYDANGNMASLFRNGTSDGGRNLLMDDLTYHYYYYTPGNLRKTFNPAQALPADAWQITNQLAHVKDVVPASSYPVAAFPEEKDIDNQPDNNYTYDGIGNLVKDAAENITAVSWTVSGKIKSITKAGGTSIVYDYDAAGNRVQKQVVAGNIKTITYYVRDAAGNPLAVYGWRGRSNSVPVALAEGEGVAGLTWDEQHLYGSSRLGMWKPGIPVPATLNTVTDAVQVGSKFFELTNHLGNVMAVISDKKLPVPANPAVTDHYIAELISAGDYSAFGMPQAGRTYSLSPAGYRYGFNGRENDNEVKGAGNQLDYGMRVYDSRLGRFLSVDPLQAHYAGLTPYQFASNTPVQAIDLDGLEKYHYLLTFTEQGKTKLVFERTEHFSEQQSSWTPSWDNWFKTAVKSVQDPYQKYIVHGAAGYSYGLDGTMGDYEEAFTWSFKSQAEMCAAESRGGLGKDPGWHWWSADQRTGTALSIGLFNAEEAELEFGGSRGSLRKVSSPSGKVTLEVAAVHGGNSEAANAHNLTLKQETPVQQWQAGTVDVYNGKFAQPDHGNKFSARGRKILGVETVQEAVGKFNSKSWAPSKLPIDYVIRNGQVYYLNTRSVAVLMEAGIPKSKWTFQNQTGVQLFEDNLTRNLGGSSGYNQTSNRKTGRVTKLK